MPLFEEKSKVRCANSNTCIPIPASIRRERDGVIVSSRERKHDMAELTGSDRERGSSMDSIDSRWVFQDDDDDDNSDNDNDDDYEDLHPHDVIDSDEDDNGEMRLIRTGPRVDSFDVEALDVPGAHRNEYYEVFDFYSEISFSYCDNCTSLFLNNSLCSVYELHPLKNWTLESEFGLSLNMISMLI